MSWNSSISSSSCRFTFLHGRSSTISLARSVVWPAQHHAAFSCWWGLTVRRGLRPPLLMTKLVDPANAPVASGKHCTSSRADRGECLRLLNLELLCSKGLHWRCKGLSVGGFTPNLVTMQLSNGVCFFGV